MNDSVFRTRSLGVPATGLPDQYADGKAAKVWQHYIGGHKQRTEAYQEFFCGVLRKHKLKRILDVACGTGVDSVMLLENGFEMTSVDASDKMLKHALRIRWSRRKEPAFDNWVIEEGNWLSLSDADFDTPDNGFDAIICLGNSFAHLPDSSGDLSTQRTAITNFKDQLRPGGWLFIDHRNYDAIIDTGKAPQRNLYYNSGCIEDIKTSLLLVDGKPSMLTLDYTVDPSKADGDFAEEGSEPNVKKQKSESKPQEVSKFRLSYCPHRLAPFSNLLKEVFSDKATHTVYGDFKPLGEVENPAYYVHVIQKPESDRNGMNGEQ
ncbi:glycine N-methyltransferase-like [Actinia tenebrosa]|uniref:Glycine N-methyltransferase n=1 Tax=Actinia tenebrosa TaxID=6105 RepID=A0A6P8HN73_ACTTE|nr:glycine N-methyltransferase-like [Actinia tenebrosa]